ncbi:MAG: NFACT RNA binding domain-containing protein [Bacillota bacterium]
MNAVTFDGIVMAAVAAELNGTLPGARVDSIYQPARLDLLIVARRPGQNIPLFASCEPSTARAHISHVDRENPVAPPAFCMLLRKRLLGARVAFVRQRDLDRVLEVGFSGPYDDPPRTLVVEVMGRHSNIILLDATSGVVLDSIKHVSSQMSRVRVMYPGVRYAPPPPQEKLDPLSVSEGGFAQAFDRFSQDSPALSCEEFLVRSFAGFGRDSARVVASWAGIAPGRPCADIGRGAAQALRDAFCRAVARIREGNFSFWAGADPATGEVEWVSVIGPPQPGSDMAANVEMRAFASAADLLDYAYAPREKARTLETASSEISRVVATNIERCRRKLAAQEEEVSEAERADEFRRMGELIMANAPAIKRGQARALLVDYFDPELRQVEVELDPRLSAHENAQGYFAKYSRAKRGLEVAREQVSRTRSELEYLEQVATTIELAQTPEDIDDIRHELVDQGYLAPQRAKQPKPRQAKHPPRPMSFLVDGLELLVGRNNRENDVLTMKIARPDDVWMHARGIPGAHVIVRVGPDGRVADEALLRAAEIAAYYSKARAGSKVPVDYTARRHVWKPKGARPGMVLYDHEKTIVATPRPGLAT